MNPLCLAGLTFVATTLSAIAGEFQIEELEIHSLDFKLPEAILLRVEMSALQNPDFIASFKEAGWDPDNLQSNLSNWAHVYRASDGMIFLVDDLHKSLWVRGDEVWRCVVLNVRILKTFGAGFPGLPVRYFGNGLFAIAETVPGEVDEESAEGFPQARAVTFLIDSRDGTVKERSETFVYAQVPSVRVPDDWVDRYKLKREPAAGLDRVPR